MTKGDSTGERVGGYRVLRRLATGGTSDVLLAKAEGPHGFERTVVLKLLLSQYRNDEEFARMFAREAAAYARLSHPSIVRLFDFFALDAQLVMVLEYVDGPPLSRLRSMLKTVGQQLDDRASIYVAARVFDALSAAHAATDDHGNPAPVIHRDVNPSNVLIPWDGHVKLADFGVAKVAGLNHQSVAGMIKGTFGYMSPEQVTGESPTTPRADVYAGGIMLWELLARRRAFQRGALGEMEALRQMAEPHITPIDIIRPDLDKAVKDAITRALEPRADKRTITAEEMVSILRTVVPTDEGRERLAAKLALVRHEPKPASSSTAPPGPSTESGDSIQAVALPRPASLGAELPTAPRPIAPVTAPPLPGAKGVSRPNLPAQRPVAPRMTPAYGTTAVAAPPPPPHVPPKPTTKVPTATAKLSGAVPAPLSTAPTTRDPNKSSERDVELVQSSGRETDKRRIAAALDAIAPGVELRDAIDEVLRAQPSSVPPSLFDSKKDAPATPRLVGDLPQAPAPLTPLTPLNVTLPMGAQKPKMGSGELPQVVAPPPKTTKSGELPALTPPRPRTKSGEITLTAPGGVVDSGMRDATLSIAPEIRSSNIQTAIADALAKGIEIGDGDSKPDDVTTVEPLPKPPDTFPALDHTLAMERPVVPLKTPEDVPTISPPALSDAPPLPAVVHTATAPMPMVPPPAPPSPPMRPPMGSVPSAPGIAHSTSSDASGTSPSLPRQKSSGSSAGIIAFVLVILVALGVGGTFGYVRWQRSVARPLPVPTTPTTPVSTAVAIASSAPPVVPPPVSASTPASAVAVASASASPPEAADSGTAVSDSDTGVIKTSGTAPHRRIFVDEKVVGQTPESATVKCGPHVVRLGSGGAKQNVDVPCGGEVTVGDVAAPIPKKEPPRDPN